jgi:tripartite-type tricarboxylate transporter receptor subunit TctC
MRAAGKVKVLGLAGSQRAGGTLADVPTLAEQGIRGAESGSWYGLVAPRGLPKEVRARLSAALGKVLVMPEVQTRIAATGLDPALQLGDAFRDYMSQQWDTYGRVIRSRNISLSE